MLTASPPRVLTACLLLWFAAGLTGCAAVPLAAVGTAASVGKTGFSVFKAGKLDAVEMVSFDAMREAAIATIEDLSLTLRRERSEEEGELSLSLRDDTGAKFSIHLLERTATMTRVRIDVGLFGSEAAARLILKRINANLVEQGVLSTPGIAHHTTPHQERSEPARVAQRTRTSMRSAETSKGSTEKLRGSV